MEDDSPPEGYAGLRMPSLWKTWNDGCVVCGCSEEFDEVGDRKCHCDPCKKAGGCMMGIPAATAPENAAHGPCTKCGCSTEIDADGERVCWCSTCMGGGNDGWEGGGE